MSRTVGTKNIASFDKRDAIASSHDSQIKHLATEAPNTSLDEFLRVLTHQRNYIDWIQTRHDDLTAAKDKIAVLNGGTARKPKDATFRKYKWYAEHVALLEVINAFEVFYKRTTINLAKAIRWYVPADRLKGSIDTKILWSVRGRFSFAEMIFEHQLYHDLDNIDRACESLILAKRYNKSSPKPDVKSVVRSLQVIFQIRHTLSHNHGLLTGSDVGKLKILGFDATIGEVIDPSKNDFGLSINRFLETEAREFTNWLLAATAKYLQNYAKNGEYSLTRRTLGRIENTIGKSSELSAINWA